MSGIATVLRVAVSFVLAADAVAVSIPLVAAVPFEHASGVFLVTGAIMLCLAVPAYLALRLYGQETWRSCTFAGFLVGAIVTALVLLPVPWSETIEQEMTVVAGVRTAAGWRMLAGTAGIGGGIGAGAGGVFWAALRLLDLGARWPRLGSLPVTAGSILAIAASGTILAIPSLTMDRSCHNVLRDGRRSIAPVLCFTVELKGEWSRLQAMAERFAAAEGWNIDESNDKDKSFSRGRFVNACIEPGTMVWFEGAEVSETTRARVSVFQPQGGDSWQEPVGRLLALIEAGLPGRLRRGFADTEAQTSSMLLPQR